MKTYKMVEDRYYPYYELVKGNEDDERPDIKVSDEFLKEYNRVMAEFYALQEELKNKYKR